MTLVIVIEIVVTPVVALTLEGEATRRQICAKAERSPRLKDASPVRKQALSLKGPHTAYPEKDVTQPSRNTATGSESPGVPGGLAPQG